MKDEIGNDIIREVVAIKSKTYSILKESDLENKRLKGVKKYVVKRDIKHQDYKDILFGD